MYKRAEIGERIRKARVEKGLTQENLAEKVCMIQKSEKGGNPQTISRIENAVNDFGIDTFLAVAEALEVSPESLLPDYYIEKYGLIPHTVIGHEKKSEERFYCMMDLLNHLVNVVERQ